jgi:hypothetical protein
MSGKSLSTCLSKVAQDLPQAKLKQRIWSVQKRDHMLRLSSSTPPSKFLRCLRANQQAEPSTTEQAGQPVALDVSARLLVIIKRNSELQTGTRMGSIYCTRLSRLLPSNSQLPALLPLLVAHINGA